MHFAILVVGDDYEAALAPFDSNDGDNPQGRWDWYSLGGRYQGRLLVKQGAPAGVGSPGIFDNEAHFTGGVDQARLSDIDWSALRSAARRKAEESLALIQDPEKRKDLWMGEQKVTEALSDPEKWINSNSVPLSCWGFVHAGQWHDRYRREGEYSEEGGYPDTYFAEKSDEEWQAEVSEMFASLSADTLISMVDCHD